MRMVHSLIALIIGIVASITPATVRAESSAITTTKCDATYTIDRDIICGTIRIPLNHDDPDAGFGILPIMIVRSQTPTTQVPLYLLQGGPGGDTIDTFIGLINRTDTLLPKDRDIVFYEQRGTTNAKPSLNCPETNTLEISLLNVDISYAEATDQYIHTYMQCIERLRQRGINFSLFNSRQNALDTIHIAEQLGHTQIDLYGVSYGTLLAQHITRLKPSLIRSLIIDGVVPTDQNVDAYVYSSRNNSLNAILSDCEQDSSCAQAYPQLRQNYDAVMTDYRAHPQTWQLRDYKANQSYDAIIDDSVIQQLIFQLMYDTELVQAIPMLIHQLAHEQTANTRFLMSLLTFSDSIADMMYWSTQCSIPQTKAGDYVIPADNLMSLDEDEIANDTRFVEAVCRESQVPLLDDTYTEAFRTQVPLLIVSGRYDPITPVRFGEHVTETNPHATHIVVANGAHGAMLSNACAADIAHAFWADPTQTLDTSCIATQRTKFIIADELIHTNIMQNILAMTSSSWGSLLTIGVGLLSFGFALVIRILRTLVSFLWRRETPPWVVRQQQLLQSIVCVAGLIVVGYVVYDLIMIGVVQADFVYYLGVPDPTKFIRASIWGFGLLSLFNVASVIYALRSGMLRWQGVMLAVVVLGCSLGICAVFVLNHLY